MPKTTAKEVKWKKLQQKKIIIHEHEAIKRLKKYIDECDGDELARLLGELFGGECSQNTEAESYTFEPNQYYSGEFNA